MTLKELKTAIDAALRFEHNPEKVEVVISTQLPYITCGQSPCAKVKYAGMGFDWEAGQFRIVPDEKLMAIKHNVPQAVLEWEGNYHCPKCEYRISSSINKNIHFCNRCGQAITFE